MFTRTCLDHDRNHLTAHQTWKVFKMAHGAKAAPSRFGFY